MGIPHLSFNLCSRHQSRHRINNHHIHGRATNQDLGNLQGLLTRVRLRNQQIVAVYPQLSGICHIQGMFGIHKGRDAVLFLGLGHDVKGQSGLARRLGTKELYNPSSRDTTDP